MVATQESGEELICPKCFVHLIAPNSEACPTRRG